MISAFRCHWRTGVCRKVAIGCREQLATVTPNGLVNRTVALKPLLAANSREAERLRRPVDAVWDALRASGIFYHFVPKMYGGLEFGVDAFIDAMLPLAEDCLFRERLSRRVPAFAEAPPATRCGEYFSVASLYGGGQSIRSVGRFSSTSRSAPASTTPGDTRFWTLAALSPCIEPMNSGPYFLRMRASMSRPSWSGLERSSAAKAQMTANPSRNHGICQV
jgi:hypothetical protein